VWSDPRDIRRTRRVEQTRRPRCSVATRRRASATSKATASPRTTRKPIAPSGRSFRRNTAPATTQRRGPSRHRAHSIRGLGTSAGRPVSPARRTLDQERQRGRLTVQAVKILAIVLIVVGLLVLAYEGITYTKREKVLEVGPITATKETKKTIPLPPVLGGIALAGGIVLLLVSAR